MPTSGSIISFGQDLPIYSDRAALNSFLPVNIAQFQRMLSEQQNFT